MVSGRVRARRAEIVAIDRSEKAGVRPLGMHQQGMKVKAACDDAFVLHAPIEVGGNEVTFAFLPPGELGKRMQVVESEPHQLPRRDGDRGSLAMAVQECS